MRSLNVILLTYIASCVAQKNPNFAPGRTTIVHLFEWKWNDIADECERFLQHKRFAGVQVSPASENLIISDYNRPWWERYQPISYGLTTRSGDENAFADMVRRCNSVGVRIYVDVVLNHMTGWSGTGTGGSTADRGNKNYPSVPFQNENFNPSCQLNDWQNIDIVRNCELNELADLDQSQDYVRSKIIDFLNHLVDLGVAGFRVDAAKLMWPDDLDAIYSGVRNLNPDHGFPSDAKPFIYQEVIDLGGEPITKYEYNKIASILEFWCSVYLGNVFQGGQPLSHLANWGPEWGMLDSQDAVVFIDNHDNQRTGNGEILTFKNSRPYKMAIAFMLAHPYATTRVMSSYYFDSNDQGPPMDANGNLIPPNINADNTCGNGYVCEHRWREIYNMVVFRGVVGNEQMINWWSNNDQQIAFGRGNKGFVAFTNGGDLSQRLNTGLPSGTYCDVISGDAENGSCTGKSIVVGNDGFADIFIGEGEFDGVVAYHIESKL